MRPYRKEKVASVIRNVVSDAVVNRINDPRVAPFTTVTRVEMTGDLLVAKVYLSVRGDDATARRTLAGIRHAGGFIQRLVAGRLSLRNCPELRFDIDPAARNARATLLLLEENRRSQPELFEPQGDDDAQRPEDAASEDQAGGDASGIPQGFDE